MNDNVRQVKQRAEAYLYSVVKKTQAEIEKRTSELIDPSDDSPITLRIEAFSYLAQLQEDLKFDYHKQVRSLWSIWRSIKSENRGSIPEPFWPCTEHIPLGEEGEPIFEEYFGLDIVSHIAVLRAQEILGIGGFGRYMRRAASDLNEKLEVMRSLKGIHNPFWQLARIPGFRSKYDLMIEALTSGENEEALINNVSGRRDQDLSAIHSNFFNLVSNNGKEASTNITDSISKMLDVQDQEGSIHKDIIASCLFVSSAKLSQVDPKAQYIDKAIQWIVLNQNDDGSWDYFHRTDEWAILSTVIVLETLNFIDETGPLAPWAGQEAEHDGKSKRGLIAKRFPAPPGGTWADIAISFVSSELLELRAGNKHTAMDFREMGFVDRRTNGPNVLWKALLHFAKNNGTITKKTKGLPRGYEVSLKDHVRRLKPQLNYIFQIDTKDSPFTRYHKDYGYQTRFKIELRDKDII